MLRKAANLKGYHLGALDGDVGHVKEFYFDDVSWKVRYLVADTGGWLPHRKVLISPHALGSIDDHDRVVHVQLTREQIEHSPSIDADKPVSRQHEEDYLKYFGWPFYWADPLMWSGPATAPLPTPEDSSKAHGDTHLRSMNEVIGYHIQARDGDVGHVHDFLIDTSEWEIRDIIVDTHHWLPDKKVLVSPEWIREVSWEESKVFMSLNKKSLREFPEFEDHSPETDAQEQVLRAYGQLTYLP